MSYARGERTPCKDSRKCCEAHQRDPVQDPGWNSTTSLVYEKIKVTVKGAAVTPTGKADNGSERVEAGQVVEPTERIRKVDNWLTVKGYEHPWDNWKYKGQ